jgi:hypothetical protein
MFPEILLREYWPDPRIQALVHDFHLWQALLFDVVPTKPLDTSILGTFGQPPG